MKMSSPSPFGPKVWRDGQFVPWDEATVHVSAHVLHYGSSVFEGIRAYATPRGPAVFCLDAHVERMFNSCKVFRMDIPYTREEIKDAILETVRVNGHNSCYIRPLIYRGTGALGVEPRKNTIEMIILTMEWGAYLGPEAIEQGVDVGISSWRRMAPGTFPAMAKIGGMYVNSQFAKMEAHDRGFAEGIVLDVNGYVSEGSGENLFLISRGRIYTPPLWASILEGITRQCAIQLAADFGDDVQEQMIAREWLYMADELFFTGTAAEITPVRSVDGVQIGAGHRGPITEKLQKKFFGITSGELDDEHSWLTPIG
jgi:branched-chain amino acid aminotransferase